LGLFTNLMILGFAFAVHREVIALMGLKGSLAYGAYALIGAAAVVTLLHQTPMRRNRKIQKITGRIVDYVARFASFLREFKKELYAVLAISLLNQLVIIFENYLILRALNMHIGFTHVMYIVPLTFIATLLPITIAGIGIREGAFIYFLGKFHYSPENAIAFSLIGYFILLITGIAGGFVSISVSSQGKPSDDGAIRAHMREGIQ
jgi:uncharacterized protein (TIRG00374 family)